MLRPRSAAYCPRPFRRRDELSFYYRVRIANEGGWWLVKRGLRLLWDLLLWVLLLPATVTLHCLGYRRITVYSERIGHLAGEPDCLLKDRVLRELPTCPNNNGTTNVHTPTRILQLPLALRIIPAIRVCRREA
ncbi:MAG: hypothetical protein AB1714_29470 [Acidobacteriota bacterium]